ncbi:rod shape-determining protein RodA [Schleiferiaceae bacterium]|nr:rod shape-determining protein RodA [Flavobacteriales bacterium]MDC1022167.1 rod shape-determining protein RodA [Schleiferiaceae bacterium]|tara:strand:- start:482 stop:1750 length:1269 start_codon:yes stop_codon:yes gene_type:complete
MAYLSNNRSRVGFDWLLVSLYFLLCIWGWISIYAAVYNEESASIFSLNEEYGKQGFFILGGLVIIFLTMITNYRIWTNFAPLWYALSILLLILVLIIGKKVGGARSWFGLGGFSLQPSEVGKFATALMLAFYAGLPRKTMKNWRDRLIGLLILGTPGLLIALQPDMGSTLVYLSLVFVVYRAGMPGYYIGIILGCVILAIGGLILPLRTSLIILLGLAILVFFLLPKQRKHILYNLFFTTMSAFLLFGVGFMMEKILAPHQQIRIKVLLGLEDDPSGAGYNTLQSLIAIGSGGWTGKGFLNGTQTKLDFVPAQSTDYIFCTIGEEWGFIGTFLLMVAFALLIGRIIWLAERQKDNFSRYYGYGVASIFFTHWVINVGMTIGLFPTVGIPLPFFSYGGSSLWGFTLLLFIFIKLDGERQNRLS